jgi:hypothetical protein
MHEAILTESMRLLSERMEELSNMMREKIGLYPLRDVWLDVDTTCKVLFLSKRTLQNYRDNMVLPYSQFDGKIYFKASDLQEHLDRNYKKSIYQKR